MKDYFAYQGNPSITGSWDVVREACRKNMLTNRDVWMSMIKSRNQTSHTYNQGIAYEIIDPILQRYHAEFMAFLQSMKQLESATI